MVNHIFVYGTLMRSSRTVAGFDGQHPFMGDAEFVAPAHVRGYTLKDLGSFPAALASDPDAAVYGELHKLPEGVHRRLLLARLDRYETRAYARVNVEAITHEGETYEAMMYVVRGQISPSPRLDDSWAHEKGPPIGGPFLIGI